MGDIDIDMFLARVRHILGEDAVVGKDKRGWVVLGDAGNGKAVKGRGATPEEAFRNTCTCPGHPHDSWCNTWSWRRP